MRRSAATWKRVAMSLRGLKEQTQGGDVAGRRQLRVERLQAREMLAADTLNEPALQYTGGITIAGEVASPDVNQDGHVNPLDALMVVNAINADLAVAEMPAADLNRDQQISPQDFAVIASTLQQDAEASSSMPAEDGTDSGTPSTDACADLALVIERLEGVLETFRIGLANATTAAEYEYYSNGIRTLENDIASRKAASDCADEPGGSTGGSGTGGTSDMPGTPPLDPPQAPPPESPELPESPGDPDGPSDELPMEPPLDPPDLPTGDGTLGTGEGTGGTPLDPEPPHDPPGGHTLGSTGGTGATEFTIKQLEAIPSGYSQGFHGSAVPPLLEGDTLWIRGQIDGPRLHGTLLPPPPITLFADVNSNGIFEAPEEQTLIHFDNPSSPDTFAWSVPLPDDGPSPGDGEPSNAIAIMAMLANSVKDITTRVWNVAPWWTEVPQVSFGRNELGQRTATWSIGYNDVGLFDQHQLHITWGDSGQAGASDSIPVVPAPHADCEMRPDGVPCEHDKTFTVTQLLDDSVQSDKSVTITLQDDDKGEVDYTILTLDVLRNNDDDNANEIPDLLDAGSESENDLSELDLTPLLTSQMDPQSENYREGEFELQYDSNAILLWDSKDKKQLILPAHRTSEDVRNGFVTRPGTVSAIPYSGQSTVWVEGTTPSHSHVSLNYLTAAPPLSNLKFSGVVFAGRVDVTVWGVDADVDSDNDNGIAFPDHSEWEEYLEDSEYAIGKMLYPNSSQATPITVQLPPHLDPEGAVRLTVFRTEHSGSVTLWNSPPSDSQQSDQDVKQGGNRLVFSVDASYSLSQLKYAPATGRITLYMKANSVTPFHDDKAWIDAKDKLEDHLIFGLSGTEIADSSELSDRVKWMAVQSRTFYPFLSENRHVRSLAASELVYGNQDADPLPPPYPGGPPTPQRPVDDSKYAVKLLTEDEVFAILNGHVSDQERDYVLDVLFNRPTVPGTPSASVWNLQLGLYLDHAAPKNPAYILAFRGTEPNISDWLTNLSQLLSDSDSQYMAAVRATRFMLKTPRLQQSLTTAGHSLGGGLASAAAVSQKISGDTFNAAGLQRHTVAMIVSEEGPELTEAALNRFDSNSQGLITAYAVYYKNYGKNRFENIPDVLSLFQLHINLQLSEHLNLLPDALGEFRNLEGLYDFTAGEKMVMQDLLDIINKYANDTPPPKTSEDALESWLVNLYHAINASLNWKTLKTKMVDSHGLPSIWYGILHDDNGWDSYHASAVAPADKS